MVGFLIEMKGQSDFMYKLLFPIAAVGISLTSCFVKLLSTPKLEACCKIKTSTSTVDAYMRNKNKGMDGQKYSKTLSSCDFNYTGWKKG